MWLKCVRHLKNAIFTKIFAMSVTPGLCDVFQMLISSLFVVDLVGELAKSLALTDFLLASKGKASTMSQDLGKV